MTLKIHVFSTHVHKLDVATLLKLIKNALAIKKPNMQPSFSVESLFFGVLERITPKVLFLTKASWDGLYWELYQTLRAS